MKAVILAAGEGKRLRPITSSKPKPMIPLLGRPILEYTIRGLKNAGIDHILIIVGSEKVPREVYDKADFNIAIGHQPHSEVAALAIFLDRYFEGTELNKKFDGKLKIQGSSRGKKVVEKNKKRYPTREECLKILKSHGCSNKVIKHILQ